MLENANIRQFEMCQSYVSWPRYICVLVKRQICLGQDASVFELEGIFVFARTRLFLCQENYWRRKARSISAVLDPTIQARMISKVRRMLVGDKLTRRPRDEWES